MIQSTAGIYRYMVSKICQGILFGISTNIETSRSNVCANQCSLFRVTKLKERGSTLCLFLLSVKINDRKINLKKSQSKLRVECISCNERS